MVITNKTSGKILSDSAIEANTLTQKTFGLIFSKTPKTMIFQTRFGIHTFFMKYPIDVLVLDKHNKVVAMKENLKSNKIFLWNVKYETVIEFPKGTLDKTKIGDKISFNSQCRGGLRGDPARAPGLSAAREAVGVGCRKTEPRRV